MSVPKFQRNISKVEFVHTAYELYCYALRQCTRWSRKRFDYITKYVIDSAEKIFCYVLEGNSIYIEFKFQLEERIMLYTKALEELNHLNALLFPAYEIIADTTSGKKLEDTSWRTWIDYIDKETSLLTNVLKEENKRYKAMQD